MFEILLEKSRLVKQLNHDIISRNLRFHISTRLFIL